MRTILSVAAILAYAVLVASASYIYHLDKIDWCTSDSEWNGPVRILADPRLGPDSYEGHMLSPGLFAQRERGTDAGKMTAMKERAGLAFDCAG